jgi:signal transduction histidine kinase/putative methionine-R-sulfoxide reductase with GAF domain
VVPGVHDSFALGAGPETTGLASDLQARDAELAEALEYQKAVSNVLAIISRAPAALESVLHDITAIAAELCEGFDATILLREGGNLRVGAHSGSIPLDFIAKPITPTWITGRAVLERAPVHVEDFSVAADEFPEGYELHRRHGHRTGLAIPLLHDGEAIGAFMIRRLEVRPFTPRQIAVLQTFADQAVIAINNATLLREIRQRTEQAEEALAFQTATSRVLNVISRSPSNLQPVLETILETACDLCGAYDGIVLFRDKDFLTVRAHRGPIPVDFDRWPLSRQWVAGRSVVDGVPVHVADLTAAGDEFPQGHKMSLRFGHRTILAVPLLRGKSAIGTLVVRRMEVRPFSDKQVALLQTFADQAVIAIENVRLFDQVQDRTARLQEALEYQTATSDVLNVISRSPSDLQPVLDAIVKTAARLCSAEYAFIARYEGGECRLAAANNLELAHIQYLARHPVSPNRDSVTGRVALEKRTIHVPDVLADPEFKRLDWQEVGKQRTVLGVPLLREGGLLGVIILARTDVQPFADSQIELVTTFADQAVIAIANFELFDQVQARTRELQESLDYQTATSDVLKALSRSAFDLQPVLDTLVSTAVTLCRADKGFLFRLFEGRYRVQAAFGFSQEGIDWMRQNDIAPDQAGTLVGRVAIEKQAVHVVDVTTDPRYTWSEAVAAVDFRTGLGIPLLRDGLPIGVLSLVRTRPEAFTGKQIELVTTFADQAVIAIENARLLGELRAQSEVLAASVDELRMLGETGQAVSSTLDLKAVIDTIAQRSIELGQGHGCALFRYDRALREFSLWRSVGLPEADVAELKALRIRETETAMGRAISERQPISIHDLREAPSFPLRDATLRLGLRSVLIVPLLRADRAFGALVLWRRATGPFASRTVDVMQTFANQSVLAIQNARLFRQIEEKSRELEVASRHKSHFLANMSHELRTPMNAVLGFTEMMADGLYGPLPEKALKALERVQANGKHLLDLINDVLDLSKIEAGQLSLVFEDYALGQVVQTVMTGTESLARAKGLSLTAQIEDRLPIGRGDERRLTQVLLNLVGNAIKFTSEGSVEVTARGHGERFEIAVRDTGPGIAAEDQDRIFEEFQQVDSSSTRQKGGSGLGLAISKRFIEMHGGTLTVQSALGRGSTFVVSVPIRAGELVEAA